MLICLTVFWLIALISITLAILIFKHEPNQKIKARLGSIARKPLFASSDGYKQWFNGIFNVCQSIAKSLYMKNVGYQQKLQQKLMQANLPDDTAAVIQLCAKSVLAGICTGTLCFLLAVILKLGLLQSLIALIGGLLGGRYIPELYLNYKVRQRQDNIIYSFSDVLDLMLICVEAGMGLDAGMQRVAEESERVAPELAIEFKRVNRELAAGLPRSEVFHNLGNRTGVDELQSFSSLIIQSDKLGTPMSDTIRNYSKDLRVRRRLKAEELASKASIKMTFPLVLLIFPPLFIILLGPSVIKSMAAFK